MREDYFIEIRPLVLSGRFKEAAGALRRSMRAGAQLWETCIWLGRIEENRGRLNEAESAFRGALSANPSSSIARVELSRLLEKIGRVSEAQALMEEAAAQTVAELAARLGGHLRGESIEIFDERAFALLEFEFYRKAFVNNLLGKGAALARIEAALRRVLGMKPGAAGARILLVAVLIAGRRLKQAEGELAAAFLPASKGVEASRLGLLLELIELGRYGPALERVLLKCVARAALDERIVLEWEHVFSALMCARKYSAAFRLGEAMLDKLGGFKSPGMLMWPWWRKIRRAVAEEAFIGQELARLRAAGGRTHPHWFSYYRANLLTFLGVDTGLAEYQRLAGLDPRRYSWMLQAFILVKLESFDYDGAIDICRNILSNAPDHWWVRCRMAEAYLVRGDAARGLLEFERAREGADPAAKREVLTWHGEVLLWLGDYARAEEKLDQAIGLGARTFAFGWRGAARLKLGDMPGALIDLDRAVALDPKDFEARGWRGEAYRLSGRHAEALREFDELLAAGAVNGWIHFNRALSRDALGDEAGLAADYAEIPDATSYIEGKLGLLRRRGRSSEEMRRVLTAGLEWAKGVRRWEKYVQTLWMR